MRGLALILVVGVLGILAVLGSAFAVLSRLERKAAVQRVHATRAWLLARSGLEHAMAALEAGQDADYRGEDFNANGLLDGVEVSAQVYRTPALDRDSCPVRHALRPSLFVADQLSVSSPKDPAMRTVDGRLRGYSGCFGNDRMQWGLKVGSRGGFHLNGGDPALAPTVGYNATLKRILGNLALAMDEGEAPVDGQPVAEADGWALVDTRPLTARGWEGWEQVRDLALGGSALKLEALKPYLSLHAWVDKKVICPNAPSTTGVDYKSWASWKKAHAAAATGLPKPDFERMPPAAGGRIVGRAPLDFPWFRSRKPALLALLRGQGGVHLDESLDLGKNVAKSSSFSTMLFPFGGPIGTVVNQVADGLASCTSELETWEQWKAFCDSLSSVDSSGLLPGLMKVTFNPNSDLKLFNPPFRLAGRFDKSEVTAYATELDLEPGGNGYVVESLGRVLDVQGRLLASRSLTADLAGSRRFRLTTQKEFVCGDLGRLDEAGDESAFRVPGAAPYISQSWGTERTWGHRLDTTPQAVGSWMDGDSRGLGLQTYPEPSYDDGLGGGLRMQPADYDGHLQLATVETPDDGWYGVAGGTRNQMMLARWDDSPDLDVADSGARQVLPDGEMATGAELGNGLLHPAKPVNLYPDGWYSDYRNAPAYLDAGSANGKHGLISFWVRSGKRWYSPLQTYVKWTHFEDAAAPQLASPNQFFWLGLAGTNAIFPPTFGYSLHFETWRGLDLGHEFRFSTATLPAEPFYALDPWQYHRWHLVTAHYDFEAPLKAACGELIIDQGADPTTRASDDVYTGGTIDPGTATDITEPDFLGPHRITLGHRWLREWTWAATSSSAGQGNAHATFDEFAIYDFGQDDSAADVVAANRFKEGRYYKGSAYSNLGDAYSPAAGQAASFFTAPIRLPPGSRITKLSWTLYRGEDLPDDYVELALVSEDASQYLGESGPDGTASSRSVKAPGWTPRLQRWALNRAVPGPFRMQVVFRRPTPVDAETPILESPILDDLTVDYRSGVSAPILSFSEGQ